MDSFNPTTKAQQAISAAVQAAALGHEIDDGLLSAVQPAAAVPARGATRESRPELVVVCAGVTTFTHTRSIRLRPPRRSGRESSVKPV